MNDQEADKLLRDLFQEAGQLSAPEGLDARILQRIAVTPKTALVIDEPLLPTWVWVAGGALLAGIAFLPGGYSSAGWMTRVPSFDWGKALTSPWSLMGLATCTALLGLDTWLSRRQLVRQPR